MIFTHKKKIINLIEFILFLTALVLWSTKLYIEWGTDFGVYYSGAFFTSTIFKPLPEYGLYSDFFTHKGPIYYLFLKLIGSLIGWGHHQAFVSLLLSILVFYIPIYLLIKENTKSLSESVFFLLLSLLMLVGQSTNSSIAFFQTGLLIISFRYLLLSLKNKKLINISILFLILSIFTRIDSIFFILPFLIYFYLNFKNNFIIIYSAIFKFIILTTIIFFVTALFFNFSFINYFESNFLFNMKYVNIQNDGSSFYYLKRIFLRETQFFLLCKSFLLPISLFLFASLLKEKIYTNKIFKKTIKNTELNKKHILFLSISILLSGLILLLNTRDKSYHLITFSAPLLFVVIIYAKYLLKPKYLQIMFIPFFLYSFAAETGVSNFFSQLIKNDYRCFKGPYHCKASRFGEGSWESYFIQIHNSIKNIKADKIHIVGGRGWTYFFSGKFPEQSVNDWYIYSGVDIAADNLIKKHKELLKKEKGYIFWIDNYLLEDNLGSKRLKEILDISELVEIQDRFLMYKIK